MKALTNRMKSPTPPFFKKIRNAGLAIAAIGTTIMTAPVALPVVLVKIAGYFAVAGGVMGVVSQAAVKDENE